MTEECKHEFVATIQNEGWIFICPKCMFPINSVAELVVYCREDGVQAERKRCIAIINGVLRDYTKRTKDGKKKFVTSYYRRERLISAVKEIQEGGK